MFAKFVLILTLASQVDGGQHIQYVHGFKSRESCMTAAKLWLDNTKPRINMNRPIYVSKSAVCAEL